MGSALDGTIILTSQSASTEIKISTPLCPPTGVYYARSLDLFSDVTDSGVNCHPAISVLF